MDCPECGIEVVVFAVPSDLGDVAPGSEAAAICPRCLSLVGADTSDTADPADLDADFSRIIESFPGDETGALLAIAVGLLVESLALNRQAVADLLERVQDAGADPWLVLERLAVSPTVQPDADLGRARRQLEQLLEG